MNSFLKHSLIFVIAILACVVLGPVLEKSINAYWFSILIYAGINITLAVSLNLVNGTTGQFSIGHAGFMSVGAYVSSALTLFYLSKIQILAVPAAVSQHLLFAVSLLCGGLASAVLGYLVGLPSLRLKGDYLAIVTLGFGEIIRVVLLNISAVGAARGLPGIPKTTNFAWVFSVAVLCLFVCHRLRQSPHGRALVAIREDEMAAQLMGVNTTRYKVMAFSYGAFFAGVAGGLFAHYLTYINPKMFDFNRSFEMIIMVVLGGMGSMTGATFAAVFLTGLREALRPLQELTGVDLRMIIYSLVLIGLMLTKPSGLMGMKELWELKIFRRLRRNKKL